MNMKFTQADPIQVQQGKHKEVNRLVGEYERNFITEPENTEFTKHERKG